MRPLRAAAATAGLTRRAPLTRSGPIRSAPVPRSPEEVHARRVVGARSNGRCEAYGCGRGPEDWSHRKARSAGGRWDVVNGLALCRGCHSWAERNPGWADAAGLHVPSWDDPATVPVWLHVPNGWLPGFSWWLLDPEGLFVAYDGERPAPAHYPCRTDVTR